MSNPYPSAHWMWYPCLFLASSIEILAQAPTITAFSPTSNARAVTVSSQVRLTFNQPLTTASVEALKVFSSQRGGLLTQSTTPATVSGNVLTFAPVTRSFMPGETVQYTVTRYAAGTGGSLARPSVVQFITATSNSGGGNFQQSSNAPVGGRPRDIAVGDIDGDSDLDLLTANINDRTVSVLFNNGSGTFSGMQTVSTGTAVSKVALGDIDGDGDLDLLIGNNSNTGTVSVLFNNGNGTFSGTQTVSMGNLVFGIATGDVDGDGDLDLLAANAFDNTVSVRYNNGIGVFSGTREVSVGLYPVSVALGDADNDGDLDFFTTNFEGNTVSVRQNNGNGSFAGTQEVSVGAEPYNVAVGDVDGDGDLDLLTANLRTNSVSVRLNNGTGTFTGTQDVIVVKRPEKVVLGDVDGDGDLDLLAANGNGSTTVSVRLNNGNGLFSGTQNVSVSIGATSVAVGDVDGDGDIDLLATSDMDGAPSGSVSVRLNGGIGPLATTPTLRAPPLSLLPNPTHNTATLTGAFPYAPLSIFDTLGRVLFTTTTDATGTATLALPAGLPTGIYLVRSGSRVGRLVVE